MSAERREKAALGGLVFALVAPLTYVAERLLEWAQGEAGDPRLVLRTLHTAYYWRVGVALWCGGLAAILVYASLGRSTTDPSRLSRRLSVVASLLVPIIVFVLVRWA